jgi:hypothetical protein
MRGKEERGEGKRKEMEEFIPTSVSPLPAEGGSVDRVNAGRILMDQVFLSFSLAHDTRSHPWGHETAVFLWL